MKKILLTLFIIFTLFQQSAQAEVDPKMKALGSMALYGTIGGALLGTAALAFDAKGRSVAIGASLGLYAGLIFGGYVVGSHYMKKRRFDKPQENYYPDTQDSPYEEEPYPGEQESYYGSPEDNQVIVEELSPRFDKKVSYQKPGPVYYVHLLNYKF